MRVFKTLKNSIILVDRLLKVGIDVSGHEDQLMDRPYVVAAVMAENDAINEAYKKFLSSVSKENLLLRSGIIVPSWLRKFREIHAKDLIRGKGAWSVSEEIRAEVLRHFYTSIADLDMRIICVFIDMRRNTIREQWEKLKSDFPNTPKSYPILFVVSALVGRLFKEVEHSEENDRFLFLFDEEYLINLFRKSVNLDDRFAGGKYHTYSVQNKVIGIYKAFSELEFIVQIADMAAYLFARRIMSERGYIKKYVNSEVILPEAERLEKLFKSRIASINGRVKGVGWIEIDHLWKGI